MPELAHDIRCERWGFQRTYLDGECLICRLVRQTADDEARQAANRVESLPYLEGGRTVNRNLAILAARRGMLRKENDNA